MFLDNAEAKDSQKLAKNLILPQFSSFSTIFLTALLIYYSKFTKFYASSIFGFGLRVKIIIEKGFKIEKSQTLKIYNFYSSFLINFKFLPNITHYLDSGCRRCFKNSQKCSFKSLGPTENPKFSFSLHCCVPLTKSDCCANFHQ